MLLCNLLLSLQLDRAVMYSAEKFVVILVLVSKLFSNVLLNSLLRSLYLNCAVMCY
jgi:hypothetical protein